MNYGQFKKDQYIKKVKFSSAVLWHTRELSLRIEIINRIRTLGTRKVVFIDAGKKEKWVFLAWRILNNMKLKTVGQEQQYYFPIDMAEKIKDGKKEEKKPEIEYVLDPVNKRYYCREAKPESMVQQSLF